MSGAVDSAPVLVIGSGGREHALAWKLSQSPRVSKVIVAPGNDGLPPEWERWELTDFDHLAERAKAAGVALVVVGPDGALADGIADRLEREGLQVFGPIAAAAQIESSKAFAKEVMRDAEIPTARHVVVSTLENARKFLKSVPWGESPPAQAGTHRSRGWVIKADGLALGKGVEVCADLEAALLAAERLILISGKLVIEERLEGEELSWMAFCDGERCVLLEPARDSKRLQDDDQGPNTGGMGAFSPVPGIPDSWYARMKTEVFVPALRNLNARGRPFRGLLYAGLMVDVARDQFWVIEFNARFGDPEAQVLLPRLNEDLFEVCLAAAKGDLSKWPERLSFEKEAAVVVVGAAPGYPGSPPERGIALKGPLPAAPACFAAGVKRRVNGPKAAAGLETSGGRVFGAVGRGESLEEARTEAYRVLEKNRFDRMQARMDIAAQQESLR